MVVAKKVRGDGDSYLDGTVCLSCGGPNTRFLHYSAKECREAGCETRFGCSEPMEDGELCDKPICVDCGGDADWQD